MANKPNEEGLTFRAQFTTYRSTVDRSLRITIDIPENELGFLERGQLLALHLKEIQVGIVPVPE